MLASQFPAPLSQARTSSLVNWKETWAASRSPSLYRALRSREGAEARKVTQRLWKGREPSMTGPGARFCRSFLPVHLQSAGKPRFPTPLRAPLPASRLSPACKPHNVGRQPAARTAAAIMKPCERLRPDRLLHCLSRLQLPKGWPQPAAEFPRPEGRATAQTEVGGGARGVSLPAT